MNFLQGIVQAINTIHGSVWIVMLVFFFGALLFARYRNVPPSANLVESLNAIHPAVYGFVLCNWGLILALNGHEQFGDKVFLSGASFIGGVAAHALYQNGNGNANGNSVTPAPITDSSKA